MNCEKCGNEKHRVKKGDRHRWRCRLCESAYQREYYKKNSDIVRPRKAKQRSEARKNPFKRDRMVELQRECYWNGGKERAKVRTQRMMKEQPFRWRAYLLTSKFGRKVTEQELRIIWDRQQGLCALTHRPMVMEYADVDHIIPVSRGGSHDNSNLRWTWDRANEAKGNMMDEEFVAMCTQIAEAFGRMILAQERLR